MPKFITIGENIHCSRIYKTNGKFVEKDENGRFLLKYRADNEQRTVPIPDEFTENSDWQAGKVKHCAVALWQTAYGNDAEKKAGIDYLKHMAKVQESAGADYIEVNIDEFSRDTEERIKLIKWLITEIQRTVKKPVSVDSSNPEILGAGLEICDAERGRPMLNSVSLERLSAIEHVKKYRPVVVASAAGEQGLPSNVEERIANLDRLIPIIMEAGLDISDIYVDPLVLPIATDGKNGKILLDSTSAIREKYGNKIHIIGGFSNISFGMPKRNLVTQVFTYLAVEAGADSGIVNPVHVNNDILDSMDTSSEAFKLARALLMGEDEFGMQFITAVRGGTI